MKTNKVGALKVRALMNGLVFFAPIALLVRTRSGVSIEQFFILQAVLSLAVLVFEIPAGKLTDIIGYKRTIILAQITLLAARVLLLIAYLAESYIVFLIEAFIEGISMCFSSGTESAYLYNVLDEGEYAVGCAKIANFGTVGFIISTIAYSGMYWLCGIKGLLILTIVTCMVGTVAVFFIKAEGNEKDCASKNLTKGSGLRAIFSKEGLCYILALSCISIGYIIINFFYIEKLEQFAMPEETMTLIILGYSVVQLLAERVLSIVKQKYYSYLYLVFMSLASITMVLFALSKMMVVAIVLMLVLPLLLDVPGYILDEKQNKYIDELEKHNKRAEILSVFNMGINIVEVVFLFSSALIAKAGITICFVVTGVIIFLIGGLSFVHFKHA